MPITPVREQERCRPEYNSSKGAESCGHEQHQLTDLEALSNRNLRAKKAMARELVDMGLSEEAVSRVLHLNGKPEEELVLNDRGSGR
ncbi:MAG TPA: hypothetical protein ENN18_08825 [Proteobacteria bacterium]|nr:hypothetical protein [Pseudomonadota bacterium]